MKPRSGCDSCRQRHRKCVVRPSATRCNACEETDRVCHFTPKYQFRDSRRYRPKSADHSHQRGSIPRFTAPEGVAQDATSEAASSPSTARDVGGDMAARQSGSGSPSHSRATVSGEPPPPTEYCGSLPDDSNVLTHLSPPPFNYASAVSGVPHITGSGHGPSPTQVTASTPTSRLEVSRFPILSRREADLLGIYIRKLAPHADACDEARHFALAVPRLALQKPIIMEGILALASQYDTVSNNRVSDLESTYYHSRCIELLIEALGRPPETYDSTLLTAVVISRLYEEHDNDTDTQYHHLSGTINLLSQETVARFASEGGLAEAASWIHLRQAIYVCLVRRQPIDIPLETFEAFTAFRQADDTSHANRAVYVFTKILRAFFPESSGGQARGDSFQNDGNKEHHNQWETLENELAAWHQSKPLSFEALHREDVDLENDKPFPFISMISTVAVVAMQHYYAAKIIFCLQRCNSSTAEGFLAARIRASNERAVSSYLGMLMGLALSNEHATNAFYLPSHMLSLCGYCIRHPLQRTHTVYFLEKVEETIQWKTSSLSRSLREQWAELDRLEVA